MTGNWLESWGELHQLLGAPTSKYCGCTPMTEAMVLAQGTCLRLYICEGFLLNGWPSVSQHKCLTVGDCWSTGQIITFPLLQSRLLLRYRYFFIVRDLFLCSSGGIVPPTLQGKSHDTRRCHLPRRKEVFEKLLSTSVDGAKWPVTRTRYFFGGETQKWGEELWRRWWGSIQGPYGPGSFSLTTQLSDCGLVR